jgi:8-oxo-dGTP diphosphatase
MRKIILTRALIKNKEGKYLLLKRAKDDFLPESIGKWECPGGRLDEGEKPNEQILREVLEETGLKCKTIRELPFMSMKTNEIDSNCFIFLLEAVNEKVKLSEEHSEFKWLKANEVRDLKMVKFASLLLEYFNNEESYLK